MKQFAKRLLYRVAPQWTTSFMSARSRAHSHRVVLEWGVGEVNEALKSHVGNEVPEGPFAGMRMSPMTFAEQVGPYLLGVYESELDEAWGVVLRRDYRQVIDIGAKFGYYAIGLARRYPSAEIVAFDTDWWARAAVREMAQLNDTRNVSVEGFCTEDWLAQNVRPDAFVISDCEGYEATLFSERTLPRLRSATLIIETHDCFVPGVCDRLERLFQSTHSVERFGPERPRRGTTRDLSFLPESQQRLATHEVRPPQTWLLCVPRSDS